MIKRSLCLLMILGLSACKPGLDTHWIKFDHVSIELELPSRAMVSSNAVGDTSAMGAPATYVIVLGDSMSSSHQTLTLSLPTPDHPNGPISKRLSQGAELRYRQRATQTVGTVNMRGRKIAFRCEGTVDSSLKWCEQILSTIVMKVP